MKILIVTTESFEFITTKIIEDVLGRLIRRGRTHWKSLELRIKVFCFTGIRLEQKQDQKSLDAVEGKTHRTHLTYLSD